MSAEIEKNELSQDEIVALIKLKKRRLPKSVRTYIRRLKEEGKFEEAQRVRRGHIQRSSPQEVARDRLPGAVIDILKETNLVAEAAKLIYFIWLVEAANYDAGIDRKAEVDAVYRKYVPLIGGGEEAEERIIDKWEEIRHLVERLMPRKAA